MSATPDWPVLKRPQLAGFEVFPEDRGLRTDHPSNPHYRSGFARSSFELGAALPLSEGKAHMLAALECQQQLAEEQPEVPRHLMAWSWMAMAIHRSMHRGGDRSAAIALLEEHVDAIVAAVLLNDHVGKAREIATRAASVLVDRYGKSGNDQAATRLRMQIRLLGERPRR